VARDDEPRRDATAAACISRSGVVELGHMPVNTSTAPQGYRNDRATKANLIPDEANAEPFIGIMAHLVSPPEATIISGEDWNGDEEHS